MRRLTAVLAFVAVLAFPLPSDAWGFEAHQYIMGAVIQRLPASIRPFFAASQASLVEHAIDPDLWRTAGWEAEPPRHFLDMDAYGPYPFTTLPHAQADAIRQYGRDFVEKNGTLPWRTEEIYGKLVEAFRQDGPYSRNNIKFFSAWLCHYVADAHVPFHAAQNYDGQLTGQWGIHARFEAELFERYRTRLRPTPGPPVPVPNPLEFVFGTLTESFTFVQPLLDADKAAAAGRELYDDAYFTLFFRKAGPILEKRLADSIRDSVSIIMAAWKEAGSPAVPVRAPRTPRKIRRQ
jgi:hypothetical protein